MCIIYIIHCKYQFYCLFMPLILKFLLQLILELPVWIGCCVSSICKYTPLGRHVLSCLVLTILLRVYLLLLFWCYYPNYGLYYFILSNKVYYLVLSYSVYYSVDSFACVYIYSPPHHIMIEERSNLLIF